MQQGRKSTSIGPAVRFYHWVKHGWAGFRFNAWVSFTWMLAFVVAFPLLSILTAFLGEADTAWGHITKNLLPTYVSNTLRSEEHTSELQSRPHLVCRLL